MESNSLSGKQQLDALNYGENAKVANPSPDDKENNIPQTSPVSETGSNQPKQVLHSNNNKNAKSNQGGVQQDNNQQKPNQQNKNIMTLSKEFWDLLDEEIETSVKLNEINSKYNGQQLSAEDAQIQSQLSKNRAEITKRFTICLRKFFIE